MVKTSLLLLAAIIGISAPAMAQNTVVDSFVVDGIYRSYRLYIPAAITTDARPLILNMHGLGSNAVEQQLYGNFVPIADTARFYLVMPQGTSLNGTAFWNVGLPGTPPVNDVKFLSVLIDTLAKRYPIDQSRVYATGMSNGGYMAHLLGIQLNNRIAAIASVAGTIVPNVYPTATPGRAVPAMQVHGTADQTVPYEGSALGIPIDTLMMFWVRNNGCNPVPVQVAVPNTNTGDGCTADHFVWSGGHNGAMVELYRVNGGEHSWPGSPPVLGITNQDFSASKEIWRFFSQYRLNQFTSVHALPAAQAGLLQVWPNPAQNRLYVAAGAAGGTFAISDVTGKVLLRTAEQDIDISGLPGGMYMLQYTGSTQTGVAKFIKE